MQIPLFFPLALAHISDSMDIAQHPNAVTRHIGVSFNTKAVTSWYPAVQF